MGVELAHAHGGTMAAAKENLGPAGILKPGVIVPAA
jgi:hypothetical protein